MISSAVWLQQVIQWGFELRSWWSQSLSFQLLLGTYSSVPALSCDERQKSSKTLKWDKAHKQNSRWYPGSWEEAVPWERAAPPSMLFPVHLPRLTLIAALLQKLLNIAGVIIMIIFIYSFTQQTLKQVQCVGCSTGLGVGAVNKISLPNCGEDKCINLSFYK